MYVCKCISLFVSMYFCMYFPGVLYIFSGCIVEFVAKNCGCHAKMADANGGNRSGEQQQCTKVLHRRTSADPR